MLIFYIVVFTVNREPRIGKQKSAHGHLTTTKYPFWLSVLKNIPKLNEQTSLAR